MTAAPVLVEGEGRLIAPGGAAGRLTLALEDDGFTFDVAGTGLRLAAYRDLSVIAAQPGAVLLVVGSTPDAPRLVCERLGTGLGLLVRELRDRRLRQRLRDRFVELPAGEPIELEEYEAADRDDGAAFGGSVGFDGSLGAGGAPAEPGQGGPEIRAGRSGGVAQLAYHDRGFVLAPVDDSTWRAVPRGSIERVEEIPASGAVHVDCGRLGEIRLLRLGRASARHAARLQGLRDGAAADAAALVEALIPDAPHAARDLAARLLVDGRPATPEALGAAWGPLETAVLGTPPFAESYRALVTAAGTPPLRWLSLAPEAPGSPVPRAWFVVALPGNLLAMELVTGGAHATYCFSIVPPSGYLGRPPSEMSGPCEAAVASLSGTLVDIRFLREPIGLPDDALAAPGHTRDRLAIAALPSLAAARRAFVARLVHDERWTASLEDLVTWHATCRDDAARWPGRAAQEATISGLETARAGAG